MQSKSNSSESSNTASIRRASVGTLLKLNQPDIYFCSRCSRGFPSSQSLGGHQNAHRKERSAERRQLLGKRKLKKFIADVPILPSQPVSVVPPPTSFSDDHGHQILSHVAVRLDPSHGSLSRLEKFLDFHSHIGQSFASHPPSPVFAGMKVADDQVHYHGMDLNNEFLDEIPCGIPLENHNLMPWDMDMCPYSNSNEVMIEMGFPLGEVSSSTNAIDEADTYVMKEKEIDKVTLERELDLALKL